ncbi:MAG: NAD(P)H-binding protein [Rhodocyclaceae bacterium]
MARRKTRLLIVGAGDVAQRVARRLAGRYRIVALVRQPEAAVAWRALGAVPLMGDLDALPTLRRLAGWAGYVLHCAPPSPDGAADDARTAHLLAALGRGTSLARGLVYISTTGVYGDRHGAVTDETAPLVASTARARRRVAAEARLRCVARRRGMPLSILRAPGIYASERLPLARLERGDPVLAADDDVFTNHIHADDLAAAAIAALTRGRGGRAYNVTDDSVLRMGDYYDLLADTFGLPRPPRLSRAACAGVLTPMTMSFMGESRRLTNTRMTRELRVRLRYPSVRDGLAAARRVRTSPSA